MDSQLSLLPFDSPANVMLHLEALVTRVTRLQPDLGPTESLLLLSEFALVAQVLDTIEHHLRQAAEQKARRFGLIA